VLLARQLKQMQQAKDLPGISCGLVGDNVFEWEVMLMISDDCRYYGGMLFFSTAPFITIHYAHDYARCLHLRF
jgi:ubiquitin-protein ligase